MALKRKINDEEKDTEDIKRRQVEDLMRSAAASSSSSSSSSSATGQDIREKRGQPGKRQMQGQSAESGMHSIDSDEEEEYVRSKKVEEMPDDELEGVEDDDYGAVEREGGIQITPFNMKEEREEGFVAKDGSFVFHKKEEEIKDNWLENIDWGKVKEQSLAQVRKQDQEDQKEDEAEAQYNEAECYKQMLSLMQPKESVAKAIRRLGGGKKTTAQKLKEKKRQKEGKETPEEKQAREDMATLTGLADAVLSRSGHMEVYEETYEGIAYRLKQQEEKNPKTHIPEDMDDDDALDMFMASAKDRESADGPVPDKRQTGAVDDEHKKSAEATEEAQHPKSDNAITLSEEVLWEFRWKNTEDSKIHGPHSSQKMLDWQESGFFSKGVFVRKVGTAEFRDGRRIDFDLYV